jgi:hypothetical protein
VCDNVLKCNTEIAFHKIVLKTKKLRMGVVVVVVVNEFETGTIQCLVFELTFQSFSDEQIS